MSQRPDPASSVFALRGELAEFITRRSTVSIAAVDSAGIPDLCRGLASLIDEDGSRVRAVFERPALRPVLEIIAAGADRVALVCSRPSSHRTVQIKGIGARPMPLLAGDLERIDASRAALRDEFLGIGLDPAFVSTLLDYNPEALLSIAFTPVAVFDQTPGPRAGARLEPVR